MSDYRLVYLPVARRDLLEIMEYIQKDNRRAALDMLDKIDQAVGALAVHPFMGTVPKDIRLRSLGYRVLVIGNYLVFYTVINDVVEIRRIIHGKRHYQFLL